MMRRKVLLLLCVAGYTFEASKSTCNGETTPETILTGPLYQLGDYTGCLNRREQQYCLAQVQLKTANVSSPLWTNVEELSKLRTHFRRDLLYVGLCVPAQSTVTAVSKGLEDSLRDAAKKLGVSAEVQIDQRACQTNQQQQQQQHPYSAVDLMTGFGVLVVTLLVLSGTGYDAFTRLQEHIKPSETKCTGLLLCFSLIANSKKLYAISRSESHNEFPFIQGFRAVTVSIFVLPHVFLVVLTGPVRNPEWVEKSYVNICWTSLYNSSLYLGVFFCIGGFLLSYLFLREIDGKQAFRWSDFLMVLVHRYMSQSGYVCMMFYRRDGHVIEVQTGSHTRRPEDACQPTHFDRNTLPFITLVTSRPEPRQCPYLGKYSVTGLSRDDGLVRSKRRQCIEANGAPQLSRKYLPATVVVLALVLETVAKMLSRVER